MTEQPSNSHEADHRVDISKAWDMAEAGKEDRDTAAELRKKALELTKVPEEDRIAMVNEQAAQGEYYQSGVTRIMSEYADLGFDEREQITNRSNPQRILDFEKAIDDLRTEVQDETRLEKLLDFYPEGADDFVDMSIGSTGVQPKPANFDELAEAAKKGAEFYDEYAEPREKWAGILHDSFPSKAFIEQFSLTEDRLTPHLLAILEEEAIETEESAIKAIEAVQDILKKPAIILGGDEAIDDLYLILTRTLNGHFFEGKDIHLAKNESENRDENKVIWTERLKDGEKLTVYAFGENSPEHIKWKGLLVNPETTLQQLQQAYGDAITSMIQPGIQMSKVTSAVLSQIKNGNAALWK